MFKSWKSFELIKIEIQAQNWKKMAMMRKESHLEKWMTCKCIKFESRNLNLKTNIKIYNAQTNQIHENIDLFSNAMKKFCNLSLEQTLQN
jgi:polyhydroxyalkanoate synthesis regulator protein